MSASGKNTKRKTSTSRGAQRKVKSAATTKAKSGKNEILKTEPVDPKVLEEHRKIIHAAAMEAQNAVKKALDDMADQVKYEEKYEE